MLTIKGDKINMKRNTIAKVITDSMNDGRFFSALVRLKKNGQFSRINGKVYDVRTGRNGNEYAIVDNFEGNLRPGRTRRWQTVPLQNVILVRKDGYTYKNLEHYGE